MIKVDLLAMTYKTILSEQPKVPLHKEWLFDDGRFLVFGFEAGKLDEATDFIRKNNGMVVRVSQTNGNYLLAYSPDFSLEANNQILTSAQNLNFIRYAEPSVKIRKCFIPNDSFFISQQWDKWIMYADLAWDVTIGSRGIKVAVCDQGIDYHHPDLVDNFNFGELGFDFVDNDSDPYPVDTIESHGTHVAGIIAGTINNRIGVAGWSQVTLLAVRVLNEEGLGSDFSVAEGIRWATNQGAKIINLSLGGPNYSSVLLEAVEYAWQNGVLLVAASGNDGVSGVSYPAKFDEVIAVGALGDDSKIAYFSNYGTKQELCCPGVHILSTIVDSGYAYYDGTSMACAQVSGVAALIISVNPTFTNYLVRAILDCGVIDLGSNGRDRYYGFGLLNGYRALLIAQQISAKESPFKLLTSKSKRREFKENSIYDIQGRRIDIIRTNGIYFIKNRRTINKKVVFNK